jgi:hypothetical protein
MNEQLADWLIKQSENIMNWASTEVPLFVQEYLTWHFYNNLFNSSLAFLVVISCLYAGFKCIKNNLWEDQDTGFPIFLLWLAPLIISSLIFFHETKQTIQVYVAPKVYLMERVLEFKK